MQRQKVKQKKKKKQKQEIYNHTAYIVLEEFYHYNRLIQLDID